MLCSGVDSNLRLKRLSKAMENKKGRSLKDIVNQYMVPPVFVIFFTVATQYFPQKGNPERPFKLEYIFGNGFAWICIGILFGWALLWLWIPGKKFYGPVTSFGSTPVYKANGELYYFATLAVFLPIAYVYPQLCVQIYENMGPILGALNMAALSLCLFLLIKAKLKKKEEDPYLLENNYPVMYEFYRGMELNPRIFGVDVKQLTNCRLGGMIWQLLPVIYLVASYELNDSEIDVGLLVNVLIQSVYIYKYYLWETGYFRTLDITMDRAGWMLCWGVLVWIPAFYTFPSYFFVFHKTGQSYLGGIVILVLGIAAIWLNYDVDRQKELFRGGGTQLKIWGRDAETINVSYVTPDGTVKKSQLLVSGWWGVARKINYTFELAAGLSWCVVGGIKYGMWPYLYVIFVAVLLIHRVFRDEEKCRKKYGKGWEEYCSKTLLQSTSSTPMSFPQTQTTYEVAEWEPRTIGNQR